MYEGRRGRCLRGERKNEEGDVVGGVNGKKTLRFFLEKKICDLFFVCDLFFCVRVCTEEEGAVV